MQNLLNTAINLSGRVVIVTGGGSGIGRSIALLTAAAGAKVLVQDIKPERVAAVVDEIAATGGEARAAVADIRDEQAVGRFVADVMAEWVRIDALYNNAGVIDSMELPTATSTEQWNRIIGVNLTGQFFVARAVLPHMIAAGGGAIINTSSPAGLRGGAASISYTVSKHGLIGMTKSLAWIHAKDGIRCNAICPGNVPTDIMQGRGHDELDAAGIAPLLPVLELSTPAPGPNIIAQMCLFLASDAGKFVNGAVIPIDGGWCAG
jgi:NAD(P)-dependent dehydrogenase (short-subunit alcohol dehydrogenase family)